MNWKKLLSIGALTMFSASIATGQGTTPTIVQGDYISNVFGNSNFIKNPNAKLNTKDVAVSAATVTRSPTTPLVATSEFNVTITSANGTVTWDARAFDAGMKNQNCEARFTYRGFQSTSKVQIKQSTNVVAELALTPSTDPRIASINFPCGDLSQLTKFVVTDTSTLSGSPTPNEIGGIYVGLATNMANVAQAEFYGAMSHYGNNSCSWVGTGSTTQISANANCTSYTQEQGASIRPATNIPGIRITPAKSGNYQVLVNVNGYAPSASTGQANFCTLYSNGSFVQNIQQAFFSATGNYGLRLTGVANITMTSGTIYDIDVRCTTQTTIFARSTDETNQWTVYRFPSSSELVVKPETQNVFAGIRAYSGSITNIVNTSAVWTKLTSGGTLTRVNFGKAKVETNNDYSITIDNMPVGSYAITVTGQFHAEASAAGNSTPCIFGISDSVGGTIIAAAQQSGNGDSSLPTQANLANTFTGIYTNSSVANRTFTVQALRITGGGNCYGFASTDRPVTITITPLDQPSNSALYVQGPVLGAQTGAAIPAGYVGEKITWTTAPSSQGFGTTASDWTNASISVNPGVYLIIATINAQASAGTTGGNDTECSIQLTDSLNNVINNQWKSLRATTSSTGTGGVNLGVISLITTVNVTSANTIYKLRGRKADNNGTGGCTAYYATADYSDFFAIRLN